jgi:hypothetical protein
MKKGKGLAFLNHVLFLLSNVSLERFDSANFEKDMFFRSCPFSKEMICYT